MMKIWPRGLAKSFCLTRLIGSIRTRPGSGAGNMFFRRLDDREIRALAKNDGTTFRVTQCRRPSRREFGLLESTRREVVTHCDIALLRICLKTVTTFGRCRNFSATKIDRKSTRLNSSHGYIS